MQPGFFIASRPKTICCLTIESGNHNWFGSPAQGAGYLYPASPGTLTKPKKLGVVSLDDVKHPQ